MGLESPPGWQMRSCVGVNLLKMAAEAADSLAAAVADRALAVGTVAMAREADRVRVVATAGTAREAGRVRAALGAAMAVQDPVGVVLDPAAVAMAAHGPAAEAVGALLVGVSAARSRSPGRLPFREVAPSRRRAVRLARVAVRVTRAERRAETRAPGAAMAVERETE